VPQETFREVDRILKSLIDSGTFLKS